MTTFGALFLNEKVRWKRWTAVIVGFAGVVVVINPGELKFGYYFIFPLLSSLFLSIRDLVTKNMKTEHNSLQIAFITCLVVTIFFGFLSIYKKLMKFWFGLDQETNITLERELLRRQIIDEKVGRDNNDNIRLAGWCCVSKLREIV